MPLFLNQELGFDNVMIAKLLTYYEISTLFGTIALGLLTDLFYAKRSPVAVLFVSANTADLYWLPQWLQPHYMIGCLQSNDGLYFLILK